MVMVVQTYECEYRKYWSGGDPTTRWYFSGLIGCWKEWIVISDWDIRKVQDYANG